MITLSQAAWVTVMLAATALVVTASGGYLRCKGFFNESFMVLDSFFVGFAIVFSGLVIIMMILMS